MALTISRPVQIFALVAIVAAVGGVGMLALKPKHAATPPVVVTKAPVKPATMAPTHRATTTPSVTAKPAVAPKPATTAPKPPVSPVGTNGLPNALNAAFRKHRIVVVSLFDPQSSTDAISYAEARAAGAGFLGVSLMDSTTAGALTTALPGGGLLPEPGILIYRAPGTLVERIDGFTDRDVVAQAAAASVTAPALTGS